MPVKFDTLQIGHEYDRPFLASLWGYQGHQAISKGVVTPTNSNLIILFVTRKKQSSFQQYNDYIDGNLLFWEGEDKHGCDQRIIASQGKTDEIHLLYREAHHTSFVYFGQIHLLEFQQHTSKPSEFIFQIKGLPETPNVLDDINQHAQDFRTLDVTEQQALVKSRIGQGIFRENLIKIWGSCSLTGLKTLSLLRASHIKPWRDSTNPERLNPYNGLLLIPNYDVLFDRGLIAFRENGEIILSGRLSKDDQHIFHVENSQHLRIVWPENKEYLEYHRDKVLRL